MRRILLVMSVAALMVAMMVAMAGSALAQDDPSCEGLRKAITQQSDNRPGGANEKVLQQAAAQGCVKKLPSTGGVGGVGVAPLLALCAGALVIGSGLLVHRVSRQK